MPKMSKLFDQNNMFFAIMGVLFDLIILNVLTLLCCIPIVTAGAAFTAMHSVLWRMVRHEETYVARQFFESFKRIFSHCCHATKTPLRCICGTPPNLRSDSFHAPCACW